MSTPLGGNGYLTFQGRGISTGGTRTFTVLCGDDPPMITAGYATWTNIARPLQRGLSIFTSYVPATMTVNVRFGIWTVEEGWRSYTTPQFDPSASVEDDIFSLEWMAGAGFQQGPSPVVYIRSFFTGGGDTNLITKQYRALPWVINGGIQWGKSVRNAGGSRVYQEATITLMNYLNLDSPPASSYTAAGGYFTTRPGQNTALKIAGASVFGSLSNVRSLAQQILKDSKNNPIHHSSVRLERKSISYPIKDGLKVWVPAHKNA